MMVHLCLMLSTPPDLSTPKRRKLYHRDPSYAIPKQTLWYTANKARKETMNADNGSDNEDEEYPNDLNPARSNYGRDEDPSDSDGGGGGDGGDEDPSDSDGGGGGDGGDEDPSDSDGGGGGDGGDEDPSDSDGGGGGDEDHGDSGDGEFGGAGANNGIYSLTNAGDD